MPRVFSELRLGYLTLFAVAGCVFAVAAALGQTTLQQYFAISFSGRMFPIWVLPPVLWLGGVAVQLALRRTRSPSYTLLRIARRHRTWLFRGVVITLVALSLGPAFGAIKDAIPRIVPFYADPYLIDLDRMIFGVDPWHITHALLGPFGTLLIDRIYSLWFFVMMGVLAWLAFTRDVKLQVRGLLAFNLSWALLGNAMAIALASVGPCFVHGTYGRTDFLPLMNKLDAIAVDISLNALWAMQYLEKVRGTEAIGGGISAMPSLHVAIAFLFWLICLDQLKSRVSKALAGAFAFAILIGSVHLGWHYAVDGLVSIVGVVLIWSGCGRFVDWVAAREARLAAGGQNESMQNASAPGTMVLTPASSPG